jgi:asparagine synthase (glutamine-hydrolysing)
MCGITGVFTADGRPVEQGLAARMLRAIGYRGPDDQGVYECGEVGLAHARLSIIDVAGGQQPMTNEDRTLWITYNGEIFNYVELRAELERKGHRFATRSDTEVILHLYEEKGEACVHDLNGQWAFALWDGRKRRMFLSRDRMGVRPLFFSTAGHRFAFASEVKALFVQGDLPRELDPIALDQIFTVWAPLAPRTVFKHVSELPPGHSLSVDAAGSNLYAYWRPTYHWRDADVDPRRCAGELLELLTDATRIRLRADVPVGAYLSGGLDSTLVTALAKGIVDERLRSFSVTFDDPAFDEHTYQDEARAFLGTDHTSLRCSADQIADVLPAVVWHTERPILRTAPAPLFMLSRIVREHGYKVVLTGEGADEVFGGYDIFKEAKIRAFIAAQPRSTRRPQLLKRLYPYLQDVQAQPDAFLRAFFRVDAKGPGCFFSHLPRWTMTAQLKRLFSPELRAHLSAYDVYEDLKSALPDGFEAWDLFSRAQYLEATILLPGYILSSQGDRVAMAHAVEGRFPFLDHRVVEFAASLPPELKMRVLNEKYILKQAAANKIPARVRQRTKQPYRAPEAACFIPPDRARALPQYVETLLSPERLAQDGVFNPAAVGQLVAKARTGRLTGIKDNMGLVGVLSTSLLIDRYLRRSVAS